MEIKRDSYLKQLISRKHSGMVKIISGIRRCGKSYLLNKLFREHLRTDGVPEERIISIALDDYGQRQYREPETLYREVTERVRAGGMHYLLLDEVQLLGEFESVLNGLMRQENLDIYVTGSNSRFLSTDVVTEFRGRGDEIRVHPLSFAEYCGARNIGRWGWRRAWEEYSKYGGMPQLLSYSEEAQKEAYLQRLMRETYLKDIIERNKIRNSEELEELLDIIASGIGGLTNASKLERRFKSEKKVVLSAPTIRQYLDCMQDAFLIERARRYDVKGKKYINTPCKYYMADMGLRNARLNFRQTDMTHIMENVIYNELCIRGYQVDVGEVKIATKNKEGKSELMTTEVDFVVNRGSSRFYVQSAWMLPTAEKLAQEKRPLLHIGDTFRKMIIVGEDMSSYQGEDGIVHLSLADFLFNGSSLERLFGF